MRPEFKKPLESFFREGMEDYIGLWEVFIAVSIALKLDESKMTLSDADKMWQGVQEFIILMMENKFIAVDFVENGDHTAWPDQNPATIINRIKELWIEREGDVGFSIWFYFLDRGLPSAGK